MHTMPASISLIPFYGMLFLEAVINQQTLAISWS